MRGNRPEAASIFHPWLAEAQLIAWQRRRAWTWRAGSAMLALSAALLLAPWLSQRGSGDNFFGWGLQAFSRWPLAIALLLAAVGYAVSRARLLVLSQRLRTGWWAAAPVHPAQLARTVLLVGAAAAAAVWAGAAGVIALTATLSGGVIAQQPAVMTALAVMSAGWVTGSAAGTLVALRRSRPRMPAREGIRQPLFAWTSLDDARLPHLCDWQRRATVLAWRRGGNAGLIAAAGLVIPGGIAVSSVLGVLLLAVVVAWLAVAQRASSGTAARAAVCLLTAPLQRSQFFLASLRYPFFAGGCALAVGLLGIGLLGLSWRGAGAWMLLVAALTCRWPLTWWWGERGRGRGRGRGRDRDEDQDQDHGKS